MNTAIMNKNTVVVANHGQEVSKEVLEDIKNNMILSKHARKMFLERKLDLAVSNVNDLHDSDIIKAIGQYIDECVLAYYNTDGTINIAINRWNYFVFARNDEGNYVLITYKAEAWYGHDIYDKQKLALTGYSRNENRKQHDSTRLPTLVLGVNTLAEACQFANGSGRFFVIPESVNNVIPEGIIRVLVNVCPKTILPMAKKYNAQDQNTSNNGEPYLEFVVTKRVVLTYDNNTECLCEDDTSVKDEDIENKYNITPQQIKDTFFALKKFNRPNEKIYAWKIEEVNITKQ